MDAKEANSRDRQPPRTATPIGTLRGIADEYGTIWDGEPGAAGSTIIGDLVIRADEETSEVYLR